LAGKGFQISDLKISDGEMVGTWVAWQIWGRVGFWLVRSDAPRSEEGFTAEVLALLLQSQAAVEPGEGRNKNALGWQPSACL
jgi:hypothetical protein